MIISGPDLALIPPLENEALDVVNRCSRVVDRATNFASVIAVDRLRQEKTVSSELAVLSLLFRTVIERCYASSQLIKSGAMESASVVARSQLEGLLGFKYMLHGDRKIKTECYRFIHLQHEVEAGELALEKAAANVGKPMYGQAFLDQVRPRLDEAKKRLSTPSMLPHVAEYANLKAKKRPKNWYTMYGGPNNLRDLATKVGSENNYLLYKHLSKDTHLQRSVNGFVHLPNGETVFKPITWPEAAVFVANVTATFMISGLTEYVDKLYPEWKENYLKWYEKQMRKEYMAIQKLAIKVDI